MKDTCTLYDAGDKKGFLFTTGGGNSSWFFFECLSRENKKDCIQENVKPLHDGQIPLQFFAKESYPCSFSAPMRPQDPFSFEISGWRCQYQPPVKTDVKAVGVAVAPQRQASSQAGKRVGHGTPKLNSETPVQTPLSSNNMRRPERGQRAKPSSNPAYLVQPRRPNQALQVEQSGHFASNQQSGLESSLAPQWIPLVPYVPSSLPHLRTLKESGKQASSSPVLSNSGHHLTSRPGHRRYESKQKYSKPLQPASSEQVLTTPVHP
jgi:hypothetical protein